MTTSIANPRSAVLRAGRDPRRSTLRRTRSFDRFCGLLDAVVHTQPPRGHGARESREWLLVDTRGRDPGEYLIRGWRGAGGTLNPVELPPSLRWGGAIGLFTLDECCVSMAPCPQDVDEGAGLLLLGFSRILALPLRAPATGLLEANWLVVLSVESTAFGKDEVERIVVRATKLFANAPPWAERRSRTT